MHLLISTQVGPNAFVESEGKEANNDTGPHERWAMGTLYDNIICNTINIRNRFSMGTGQGWAGRLFEKSAILIFGSRIDYIHLLGVYQVVYNCTSKKESIIRDAPHTKNWLIGFKGRLDESRHDLLIGFKGRLNDSNEDQVIGIQTASAASDSMMNPRSLYWSQLIMRMGGNSALVEQTVGPFVRKIDG